jgi:uncharacterized protein
VSYNFRKYHDSDVRFPEFDMYIHRALNLKTLLKKKSFFLFGPRATGKTTLIRHQLKDQAMIVNLLRSDVYLRLSAKPHDLETMIPLDAKNKFIVLDEVQRVPMLLNEVHHLIEERNLTFLLTGSSARRLKKQDVNLLGGRAWEAQLFPLTFHEIPDFNLTRYLQVGGLPVVYLSEDPYEELIAYINTYLKEEIQSESLVRKLPAFLRFLKFSALTSGKVLNFTSIANDASVPTNTVREYYHILEDTFIGFLVPAWTKSVKRKPTSLSKFYFFDLGARNTLCEIKSLPPASDLYGQAFEHFIALELRAYISYQRLHVPLSYWATKHGQEVDFIVGDELAIEVKTTNKVSDKHLTGLKLLQEENICQLYFLISQDPIERNVSGVHCLPWKTFLKNLWAGDFI